MVKILWFIFKILYDNLLNWILKRNKMVIYFPFWTGLERGKTEDDGKQYNEEHPTTGNQK